MSETPDKARLKALEDRIEAARRAHDPGPARPDKVNQANMGWHMVIELVVGMAIGLGIGYGLDMLIGTAPAFLILFGLLGFAAGIKVMLETAKGMGRRNGAPQDEPALRQGPDEREG
ncbi:MAG: AtpZ/AtpI family protein [Rubricella sp.]